jgi:hypothetical protein
VEWVKEEPRVRQDTSESRRMPLSVLQLVRVLPAELAVKGRAPRYAGRSGADCYKAQRKR